jgi:hypothetical protein
LSVDDDLPDDDLDFDLDGEDDELEVGAAAAVQYVVTVQTCSQGSL